MIKMTTTFLATPETWFDLPAQVASCAESGLAIELTLTATDGRRPLGDVALEELQAIHHTFGTWWYTLGTDARPASLRAGAYDEFLADSRLLLRKRAEEVLASPGGIRAPAPALVTLPPLHHAVLADPQGALRFFKSFLDVRHSRSLIAWARGRSSMDAAVLRGVTYAWLRVVLQKVADEDELAEAIICLRAVYGVDDPARDELLKQESRLLEQSNLQDLEKWRRSLGLDRYSRSDPGIEMTPRRPDGPVEPDVTVIVPSHCHEAFIEAALESVLAQTHQGFRLRVLDDCSSDGTVDRTSRIRDARLQIGANERNLGLADTVLSALDGITTPYMALLNSDDIFHPERLQRCIAVLRSSERINVVATGVVPIDASGYRLAPANVRRLFDGSHVADWIQWFYGAGAVDEDADLLSELLEHNFLVTSSNIVCRTEFLRSRRTVLHGLKYCFDWQIFLDAAIDGALAYIPEGLVGYRLHTSNTMWFDDARREGYTLEVNRVLAGTYRRLAERWRSPHDARQLAAILDRLTSHAMKHSHANSLLLYAVEVLGPRTLELTADRSDAVRRQLHLLARPNRNAQVDDESVAANAARVIAETWEEESKVARGSERWLREQLRLAEQEAAGLRASPEWRLGDALWNRARLSRIGIPLARGFGWLRDRRTNDAASPSVDLLNRLESTNLTFLILSFSSDMVV